MTLIYLTLEKVSIVIGAVVLMDFLCPFLQHRSNQAPSTRNALLLPGLWILGLGVVAAPWRGRWVENSESSLLRPSGIFLYLSVMVVYLEVRSLLSRGYSLRILLDLYANNSPVELSRLKSTYGAGMGLKGLLRKRIRTHALFIEI